MMTEICQYLKNWFDRDQAKFYGQFVIDAGNITLIDGELDLVDGQYFRIIGSLLNDGVYQYPSDELVDESFEGAIWSMAVPPAVLALSDEIDKWQEKNGQADSKSMSPFQSESFGGYSYSKDSGSSSTGSGNGGWQSAFANRLNPWRKVI